MTLNDHFTLNSVFFAGMSRALKPGFRSLATLKLVVNVGEHQTRTNCCGVTRFPCDCTASMFNQRIINIRNSLPRDTEDFTSLSSFSRTIRSWLFNLFSIPQGFWFYVLQCVLISINFPILSAFHISRIQPIALLCPHLPIPDLLSMYLMVSFILGWKLTSSLSLFLLSLSLSLLWTDLTDYCPAGL